MTELDVIALYGPGNLKAEDLVAGFVARETTLEYFLGELRQQTATHASPRHHLIIGQRGMGKTTLLHRIAIAVGEHEDLSQAFVPLTFREEQYNVINLHVFWRNVIEALLEWLEQNGHDEQAKNLERQLDDVEQAYEQNRKDQANGDSAWRMFKAACATLGKRPVLFLDNLDLILDALKKHDWGLRDILQQSGCPIVVGAAAVYPKSLSDRKAAFFDFFRLTTLARLESHEVRACLQRLAQKRGEAGGKVVELLRRDPGRINALTEMTGGNPRTLAVLYLLLESQAGEDAFADLEKLLDRMTPLYKARTEEAAPQARAVLDAVALNWDPITANGIAKVSGLEVTVVNAQLKRLENDGFLEKVPVSGSGRSGYQMIERFFNIWYLMRHGSRRLKQKVCWLTAFLRGFYTPGDREDLARGFLRNGNHKGRADLMLALSESVEDPVYRKALSQAAGRDLLQQSPPRKRIEQLVDLRDIAPELADMAELERKAQAVQREWPEGWDARNFWELLGGTLEISGDIKRSIIEHLLELGNLNDLIDLLNSEYLEISKKPGMSSLAMDTFKSAVRDGSISHRYDLEGMAAAALQQNKPEIAAIGCLVNLNDSGNPEEVQAIRKRFSDGENQLWELVDAHPDFCGSDTAERGYARGRYLAELGFLNEAEATLRKAGETGEDKEFRSEAWYQLGYYLYTWERYQDAETACRRAIEIDPANANAWNGLGNLLKEHFGRFDESEAAYRQAIALDPNDASIPWNGLGTLLQNQLQRYDEAELAYRRSIELDPNLAHPWNNLGTLLHYHLERFQEAEEAYRKAIALNEDAAIYWRNLANLLEEPLERYEEAESAYRQVIVLDPENPGVWSDIANLLTNTGRYDKAEQAYQRCIELLEPELKNYSHGMLAYLYWFNLNRPNDARRHAELGGQVTESHLANLLDAARFLVEDKPGPAFNSIDEALAKGNDDFWLHYGKPIQRVLSYTIAKGYGPKFLEFMQAAGYPDRYAPLYWAFLAALEGQDILLNVNPEVRRTAERIYRGLADPTKPSRKLP
ncbi:tetratricopeptide repeat protein [Methylomonas albis]|uniref:Tetratricopeptide repeat protein n=1 Tax=Methylomonas albis TaxID=1854563 RepID=A0ABR9D033_9GAMM|nr:tetratricopeptide repeat protein [Methylomonas albis]MBD9356166.1 tetratricopeptide repeat protein [Methylomonas albis]